MRITDPGTIDEYYSALLQRKKDYTGIFYVGVRTTGIFCISTCRARKPKLENVEFYTTLEEPLQHGYRPCKVCRPTENAVESPPEIRKAISLLSEKEKVSSDTLLAHGINPSSLRRWFKKHYGITFHTYQRMFRVNTAFQELKNAKISTVAYDSGYESLSGFGYTYKRLIGASPKKSRGKNLIVLDRFNTRLGPMFAAATDRGLCLLEFTDRRMLETELGDLQKRLNCVINVGENRHILQIKRELSEYFGGQRKNFEVAVEAPGTDFQKKVWNALLSIPYGCTRSYQEQAIAIDNPAAVRAVARANGMNRISIVIPCHRVIGKDGSLTGYGGGLPRKKWLLQHERNHSF